MWKFIIKAEVPKAGKLARTANALVKATIKLPTHTRLEIYANAYFLRLHECLSNEFPQTKKYLGEHPFWNLTTKYIEKYPSRSYTLSHIGDRLPDFIKKQKGVPSWAFELGKLELEQSKLFDAQDEMTLTIEDLRALRVHDWETLKLKLSSLTRIENLSFNSDQLVLGKANGIRRLKSRRHVLLFRSGEKVYFRKLNEIEFESLQSLRHFIIFPDWCRSLERRGLNTKNIFALIKKWVQLGLLVRN